LDGYNLIGIYHNDLREQREKLIRQLITYNKTKGHEITVVFDGWKSGSCKEEHLSTGGIKVIYSRLGEKADSVIKKIITSVKREWIVISSDREIMACAWACGSVPVSSSEFHSLLDYTGESFGGEYYVSDVETPGECKKGNPKRLSKKQKALIRALRKL
jgi:predicted RNA-binding protein with PIN domain